MAVGITTPGAPMGDTDCADVKLETAMYMLGTPARALRAKDTAKAGEGMV